MAARIGMTLVAVALLAMAPIDAGATRYTFANTGGDVYKYDGTSASDSWSDTNSADIREATAFADYGVLKAFAETTMLGAGASGGTANATARWQDNVVFTADNASLAGQSGIATVVVSVSGSLVATIGDNVDTMGAYGSIRVQKNIDGGAGSGSFGWDNFEAVGPGGADGQVIGTFSIDIPIVFGEHFDLVVTLTGGTEIYNVPYSETATGTAKADLGNSLYWGGVTKVVDSNGAEVAYRVTSESGHNWALSSVPGAVVPGDNTSSSSSGGSCSAAPGRGSDALSGAAALLTLLSPMAWLWAARRRERRNR